MTPSQKLYGFIGLVALPLALYAIFVLGFLWGGINKNAQELTSARAELARNEAMFKVLEDFQKTLRGMGADSKRIDELFIDKDIPLDFSLFLQNLAKDNNLSSELSSGGSGAPKKEPWDFINFQIALEGNFRDVFRFIDQLEKAPYLIEIQGLRISSSATEKMVRAYLSLKVFAK
ncbi:MAG: hypothetical protein A2667_02130 [Candidatus Wildermuthbacteria bacterium RIFCSPHIGHO2_01_FULL_47_27]|uniref:Uncharacterized protein n=2 Tax=Candidatus Wildermuthiibacteriota TaxID=1817923 RepID=A0A1G2RRB8_9BACT|nr:MAG: hypothetical protein UY15_C0007G0007 [Parcubacteria group bacterium GW2011_GWA2_47_9]OHA64317.1 MAG: hypothetical protein A2667_02130 [Candidatus Wildermuthbacteria bacterium RIFCSPHIGHO2_01_FULL_47_27]OHA68967.1 MAG: hypothetical protein A3D59_00815 [Candidatus Wildermuthbacteria bacterium RIFCSPHIGHO2_02_FULL_47_17]OHA75410.1 MAG: hypothetical protein A3A32_00705 [Candidatus Wildermuthbacteria bacterium RIFCSPLOWO2_01_FULL_48_35]OHA75950.1 MAG: hypothetical protein A3I38_04100 [Candid